MNDQTLQALEQRVVQLEKSFGVNPETVVEVIHERSLSQQISALEERLNTNLKEGTKKNVQSKLKKYETQREFLEQVQKDPTFLLTLDEKGRLLSMYEEEIENTLKNLEKVKGLSKYLDFPPITEVEKKLATLEPIEIDFAGQTTEYLDQEEKFRQVLEIYNTNIREINLQFMYLESLVTKLENTKK